MPRPRQDRPTAARTAPKDGSPARGKALAAALSLCLGLASATAMADVPKGVISEIIIEGNDSIPRDKILAKLKSREGRELDERAIEDDLNALAKTGWFSGDIQPFTNVDRERGGYKLIYRVQEMPVLRAVEFRGMTKIKVKDVESNTGLKVGARADHVKNQMAVGSITRITRKRATTSPSCIAGIAEFREPP